MAAHMAVTPIRKTPLHLLVACSALSVRQSAELAFDKGIQVSVHYPLHVACLDAGSMIFDHLIRLKDIRANLTPPGDIPLLTVLPVQLGPLFILFDLVKLGL